MTIKYWKNDGKIQTPRGVMYDPAKPVHCIGLGINMTSHAWFDSIKWYGKLVCYLALLGIGVCFTGQHEATGQTIPTGKIVIRKIVESQPNDATTFTFRASNSLGGGQFSLGNGGKQEFSAVPVGSGYRVTETVPGGWQLTSATCNNGDNPTTDITVEASQTVTCTFTNTKLGALIVRKVTNPNPDPTQSSFPFTTSGGLAPAAFTLKNGDTQTFPNLKPGNGYKVSELPPPGWQLNNVSCTNSRTITNIRIAPGETVTCTFTNYHTAFGLSLTKSDGNLTVKPGERLTYTLAYANDGLLAADDVVLTEQVPAHTTYVGGPEWKCAPNALAGAYCVYTVGNVAKGATGQTPFVVQVNPTLPAGVTELNNRATIGTALVTEVDVDTEKTPITAAPDLQLVKSAGDAAAVPGGSLIYALTYQNGGNQGATGVTLTETLPEHTTFDRDGSSSGWHCTDTSCRLLVGDLAAGASGTVNVAVKVDNPLPTGVTDLVNSATIADDEANGADPTPANNLATVQTPVNRTIQLLATKNDTLVVDADNDGVPSPGDTLEYGVTIRNNSNVGVANVVFRDTPDPNTKLLPGIQSTQGVVTTGNGAADTAVTVTIGALAGNGATVTIRFRVRLQSELPLGVTAVQNQGIVSSSDFSDIKTDDPATPESADATRTPLRAFAQLQATLIDYLFVDSDANDVVSVGDILIYRLTLQNTGNGAAGGLQITGGAGAGLTLASGSVTTSVGAVVHGNEAGDATLHVDIPQFPAGDTALISYQMRIGANAQSTVQTQTTIAVQSGLSTGGGQLLSDDPDVNGASDATVTTLGSTVASLKWLFLPLIAKR